MERDPPPPYKEAPSVSRPTNAGNVTQNRPISATRTSGSSNAASSPPASPSASSPSQTRRPSGSGPSSPTEAGRYLPLMGGKVARNSKEREQVLEQELERVRRELAGQRMINQRNQVEGAGQILNRKEQMRRIAQLKEEANAARLNVKTQSAGRSPARGAFKEACSTDLLFLIDRTHSMAPHIKNVKQQVKQIVTDIKAAFFQDADVRVAVVTYTDHNDDASILAKDFTTSTNEVFSFLDNLRTNSGDDIPEDVLGGIQHALKSSWSQPTRCIIHIADAPPHGRIFHVEPYRRDRYPVPGTEPHGLTYEPLLREMIGLNINYFFLPIDNTTDKMTHCFSNIYSEAGADVQLNKRNAQKWNAASSINKASSQRIVAGSNGGAEGRLLFVEAEPGHLYRHLRSLVVKSVMSSAPRTATRASSSVGQWSSVLPRKGGMSTQEPIRESDEKASVRLEVTAPEWDTPGWLDEIVRTEGFCPDIVMHGAKTLDDMMNSDDNIQMRTSDIIVRKRSQPFAEGALRTASYARTASSKNPFVVKTFKRGGKGLAHMTEDMQCQALCKAFALEFSAMVAEQYALDFIVTTSLQEKSENNEKGSLPGRQLLSLEPFIEGKYIKFNNNCGYVNEELVDNSTNMAAQAFSHFTFERSQGRFLVCDLQGVGNLLTDPAVHTREHDRFQLVDTNLHEDGFKFFFAYHQCNEVCRSLQLQTNAKMLSTGLFQYKSEWPTKAKTVCCSNKLCGKIIRLETASQYRRFPWCDQCYPQINETLTRWPCEGHGPYHTFMASRFFYESQGRFAPRACPTHQTRDEGLAAPQAEDNKFFKRFSFLGKKKTG